MYSDRYMFNSDKNLKVNVSSDKNKCIVEVVGNVNICDAKKVYAENFNGGLQCAVIDCSINPSNNGYSVVVSGRTSLKEYLSTKQSISCEIIISFFYRICEIFNECNSVYVICDLMFDYNTIFIETNISEALFMYVPYSKEDCKKFKLSELAELLYLYAEEQDMYNENIVRDIIDSVKKWEKNNYNLSDFEAFVNYVRICHKEFIEKAKRNKNFSPFRQNDISERNYEFLSSNKKETINISLYSGFISKYHMSVNDENEENIMKIGRNKSWADVHISDMTVSGKQAVIYYNQHSFYLKQLSTVSETMVSGVKVVYDTGVVLLNGTEISLGRQLLKVKISYSH